MLWCRQDEKWATILQMKWRNCGNQATTPCSTVYILTGELLLLSSFRICFEARIICVWNVKMGREIKEEKIGQVQWVVFYFVPGVTLIYCRSRALGRGVGQMLPGFLRPRYPTLQRPILLINHDFGCCCCWPDRFCSVIEGWNPRWCAESPGEARVGRRWRRLLCLSTPLTRRWAEEWWLKKGNGQIIDLSTNFEVCVWLLKLSTGLSSKWIS